MENARRNKTEKTRGPGPALMGKDSTPAKNKIDEKRGKPKTRGFLRIHEQFVKTERGKQGKQIQPPWSGNSGAGLIAEETKSIDCGGDPQPHGFVNKKAGEGTKGCKGGVNQCFGVVNWKTSSEAGTRNPANRPENGN